MNASVSLDPRKRIASSLTPARGFTPTHPSSVYKPLDRVPDSAETVNSAFGHDFGQIAVSTGSKPTTDSCPLKSTPTRCPFGGACHTCPVRSQGVLSLGEPAHGVKPATSATEPASVPASGPATWSESVLPTARFVRFVLNGAVRCCKDRGRKRCPVHLGAAKPGDPRPQNGFNLVAAIDGHRPGIDYGFVQIIHYRECARTAGVGAAGWIVVGSGGPGFDDSPVPDATCPVPDTNSEITMTDAPGYAVRLGGPALAGVDAMTLQMNANNWVIARQKPKRWKRISDLFRWHSQTSIRRNAAGNYELTPSENRIGEGFMRVGGCPP
ncbi:MAG TPA: hypothetical protein VL486_03565 [Verrucomicrobiae bacterium]|nr:hypothetical protein [Verrucomicrobiae bacterium]